MSTTTTNIAELQSMLDSNPTDWDTRLILADAMEDAGDLIGANGQRWQGLNEHTPSIPGFRGHDGWNWWKRYGESRAFGHSELPVDILPLDSGLLTLYTNFASQIDAERALAERLHELGIEA